MRENNLGEKVSKGASGSGLYLLKEGEAITSALVLGTAEF